MPHKIVWALESVIKMLVGRQFQKHGIQVVSDHDTDSNHMPVQ